MPKYRNLKFKYKYDLDRESIKSQRVFLDENDAEVTPITQLFLNRVINSNLKIEGSSANLRHIMTFIKVGNDATVGNYKVNSPYSPTTETDLLKAHLREVLDVPRVICGDYYGESFVSRGASNGDS
ncbi:MAG: hypothetical protein ACRDBG_07865 [Waterburya sp.]